MHWCTFWPVGIIVVRVRARVLPFGARTGFVFDVLQPASSHTHSLPGDVQICSTGAYQFEYTEKAHRHQGPKSWEEVGNLSCIYLNLGADDDRHGAARRPSYFNYVAVQGPSGSGGWGCHFNASSKREECGYWCVCHDLKIAIPLPDASVDRIHTEEMMEHIDQQYYPSLLNEMHRLLKPGGRVRVGLPDYGMYTHRGIVLEETVWQRCNEEFPDAKSGSHRTLTNFALMQKYIRQSPFKEAEWLIYHDNTVPGKPFPTCARFLPDDAFINSYEYPLPFIHKEVNYSLGMIKRAPEVAWENNFLYPMTVSCMVFDMVKPLQGP